MGAEKKRNGPTGKVRFHARSRSHSGQLWISFCWSSRSQRHSSDGIQNYQLTVYLEDGFLSIITEKITRIGIYFNNHENPVLHFSLLLGLMKEVSECCNVQQATWNLQRIHLCSHTQCS